MKKELELAAPALILGVVVTLALAALIFAANFYHDKQQETEVSNDPAIAAAWGTGNEYTCLTKETLEFRACKKKGEKILLGEKTECPNENAAFTRAALAGSLLAVTDKEDSFNFLTNAKAPPKNRVLECYDRDGDSTCIWDGTKFHFSGGKVIPQIHRKAP